MQKVFLQLKDYQNYVFGVLFVTLALGILFVSFHERSQQHEDQAWIDVSHERNPTPEALASLAEKYEGTSAEPFIMLQYAAKLYERGTQDDLVLAKKTLGRMIDVARGNDTIVELARRQLAGIDRELADKPYWDALKGTTAAPASGTPTPGISPIALPH